MFENILNDPTTYEGKEVTQHKEQTFDETVRSKVPIVYISPALSFPHLNKHL